MHFKVLKKAAAGAMVCAVAASTIPAVSAAETSPEFVAALSSHILGKKALELSDYLTADANADNNVNAIDLSIFKRSLLALPEVVAGGTIHLSDGKSTAEGDNITVDATGNIITITASGEYNIDGTLTDGQIIVNVPDETVDAGTVKLFLNGVTIGCSKDAPIYIVNAENTSINLGAGTVNTITDGAVYTETEAAIFAKDDLTIKGEGTLNVIAETQYGIHCNNDLKINCDGGTINVQTTTADAIRGKTSVTVKSGTVIVDSEGDGIKSTKGDVLIEGGDVRIKAGNDAVQAETTLDITGGILIAGGDRGLTGVGSVNLTGGQVFVTAKELQCATLTANTSTLLLNFAAEQLKDTVIDVFDAKDAMVMSVAAEKKFSYALIYSTELTAQSYKLTSNNLTLYHGSDKSSEFKPSMTSFELVG